eukprot:CAMPEP_0171108136 /NCGR_PEP_ID=MMETSP0766_2-20121228/68228_1 /TAXON_ID=439317 /ORGANISM="Gambierdiscus australes, Strain CAWD 149" /LENGTH=34 /DNA_ID= /DNA_START= /DNA_END= /DNA_ORIENTATION=
MTAGRAALPHARSNSSSTSFGVASSTSTSKQQWR